MVDFEAVNSGKILENGEEWKLMNYRKEKLAAQFCESFLDLTFYKF